MADFQNNNSLLSNVASNFNNVFTQRPTAKFAAGARTVLRINGKPVGFATAVSWNISTLFSEIRTVDDYLPYELAPTLVSVEGTIGSLHVPGFGATAALQQADVRSFLFQRYVNIEVRDRTTNQLLFYTDKAIITSRSENITSENLATTTLTFKAIGWKDESEPQLPENYDGSKTNSSPSALDSIVAGLRNTFGAVGL